MTKAERRKKARQRAKARARDERVVVTGGQETSEVAQLEATVTAAAPKPAAASGSGELITGPIAPRTPAAPAARPTASAARAQAKPPTRGLGASDEDTADDDDADESDEYEENWDDEDEDDDGDDEDVPNDEDAVLDVTCNALAEGAQYSWASLLDSFGSAPIEDVRLGLLMMLLVERPDLPALTGQDVLDALEKMELAEVIDEAKEHLEAEKKGGGEPPAEQEVVRTTSRELRTQSKNELASKQRPVKASALRERKSSLSTGVLTPAGGK